MNRAPETDIARIASDDLLVTLLLLRHVSMCRCTDYQQREIIAQACQQAHNEVIYRMSGGAR